MATTAPPRAMRAVVDIRSVTLFPPSPTPGPVGYRGCTEGDARIRERLNGERAPGGLNIGNRDGQAAITGGDLDGIAADLAEVGYRNALIGGGFELRALAADHEAA